MSTLDILMAAAGNSTTVTGQTAYTTAGTYSWLCPAGVTSVSVVCVGGGASSTLYNSGGGGGLGYKNNITVVPGNYYTVVVGAGDGDSYFISPSICKGGAGVGTSGGGYVGDGGGNGGNGATAYTLGGVLYTSGGGGAGGYSGNGGNCSQYPNVPATSGAGGGGGGGGCATSDYGNSGGGGGVGILGQGANGDAAPFLNPNFLAGGGGSNGQFGWPLGSGLYGGGTSSSSTSVPNGAVRIIWPGTTRQFPSTNTGDM